MLIENTYAALSAYISRKGGTLVDIVDIAGDRTKHGLDNALRQLLTQKPLDQIRVRELTDLCAIRRQSFYYHFPDVYALFDWSLQQERTRLLRRQENCLTWQQALQDLLTYTGERRSYYLALLQSRGRAGLREVLRDAVAKPLEKTLAYYRQRCGISRDPAAERAQLACWEAVLLGLVEDWLCGDLKQSPEMVIALMESAVQKEIIGAAWLSIPLWRAQN